MPAKKRADAVAVALGLAMDIAMLYAATVLRVLNAIHGRVIFAPLSNSHLDTAQSWIATGESIVGIVIESIFAAVLIQRLFSR